MVSSYDPSPELKIPLQLLAGIHFEDQHPCNDMENSLMYSTTAHLQDIQTINWNQVCTVTSSDGDMATLLSIIEEGIPNHKYQLPSQLRDYHQFREHLYSIDSVIIYKCRIVIPPSLRQNYLSAFHVAHIREPLLWSPGQKLQFSGWASSPTFMLLELTATTVTRWHLLKLPHLQHHRLLQPIFFSMYVLIISSIRG